MCLISVELTHTGAQLFYTNNPRRNNLDLYGNIRGSNQCEIISLIAILVAQYKVIPVFLELFVFAAFYRGSQ